MVEHFDGKTSLWCFQKSAVETNWADLRGSSLKPSNDAILKMAVCIIALVLKNDVGGSLALIKSFQVARSITFAENWPDAIFVCIYMFLVLFKYIRNVFIFFAGIFPFWFSSDLTKDNTICFPSWEHVTQARKENFAEERSTFSKTDWGHHQRLAFEIYIDL